MNGCARLSPRPQYDKARHNARLGAEVGCAVELLLGEHPVALDERVDALVERL